MPSSIATAALHLRRPSKPELVQVDAFGAGGCLFWTDVVDTLRESGLVGWCLESVFFADTNTATIYNFYPAPNVILGIDREGTAKSQDGQQKGTLAHVQRKGATALSMKVKHV